MPFRETTLQSKAFAELLGAYQNRDSAARSWRDTGKKVVGMLGTDVPQELLIAAGLLPIQISPTPGLPTPDADRFMEMSFQKTSKSIVQKLVTGTYRDTIDFLAISNSSDQMVRLYLYLRELARVEPDLGLPALDFIDLLYSRHLLYQNRNERTLCAFQETVETWAERKLTQEDLRHGIQVMNDNRSAIRAFLALRTQKTPRVTGSEAMVVIGSSLYMEKERHTQLVRVLTQEASDWPVAEGTRVFLSGTNQYDLGLYELIESCGALVVGEDHNLGQRQVERDVDLLVSPLRAIGERYMLRPASIQKSNITLRLETMDTYLAQCSPQAAVFATQRYEDAISWDYPELNKMLQGKGIPSVLFRDLDYPMTADTAFVGALRDFLQQPGSGKEGTV